MTAHAIRVVQNRPELAGLYHLAAAGEASWHDYARLVIERARHAGRPVRVGPNDVEAIPTSAYPTVARRPLNSRLDTTKLRCVFDLHLPDWRSGVSRLLDELL